MCDLESNKSLVTKILSLKLSVERLKRQKRILEEELFARYVEGEREPALEPKEKSNSGKEVTIISSNSSNSSSSKSKN